MPHLLLSSVRTIIWLRQPSNHPKTLRVSLASTKILWLLNTIFSLYYPLLAISALTGSLRQRLSTKRKSSKREKSSPINQLMNWMRILESSGLAKVDLRLRYTKRERARLLLITRNTRDRSVHASRNAICLRNNGSITLKISPKTSPITRFLKIDSRDNYLMAKT